MSSTIQNHNPERSPQFILVIGPMESGKSAEAMRWASRYSKIGSVLIVTSTTDTKSKPGTIESRKGCRVPAYRVDKLASLNTNHKAEYESASAIIVDEAQFFVAKDLLAFIETTLSHGKDILVSGLDSDAQQHAFLPLNDLIPLATKVKKLSAICHRCGNGTEASYTIDTQRSASKDNVRAGESGYVPVCYKHMKEHHNPTL
jgi:thymidine kinase